MYTVNFYFLVEAKIFGAVFKNFVSTNSHVGGYIVLNWLISPNALFLQKGLKKILSNQKIKTNWRFINPSVRGVR